METFGRKRDMQKTCRFDPTEAHCFHGSAVRGIFCADCIFKMRADVDRRRQMHATFDGTRNDDESR